MGVTEGVREIEWHEQTGIRMQDPEPVVLCYCGMGVPLSDWEAHVAQEGPFTTVTYGAGVQTLSAERRGPLKRLETDLDLLHQLFMLRYGVRATRLTLGRQEYLRLVSTSTLSYVPERSFMGEQASYYAGMKLEVVPDLTSPLVLRR